MKNLRAGYVVLLFICITCNKSGTALTLHQTVPPGGVSVCPNKTVQFTCVDETDMRWEEFGSSVVTVYSLLTNPPSKVNVTSKAGVFTTELTDISGTTLTSTATIDTVSLGDNGRKILCYSDYYDARSLMVQLEGPPAAPRILAVDAQSSTKVNLSWTVDNSRCIVKYQVEVNGGPSHKNSELQQITLSLNSNETYSLRVRGVDAANRKGEWSPLYTYNTANPCGGQGLTGAVIAGIVIVFLVGVI